MDRKLKVVPIDGKVLAELLRDGSKYAFEVLAGFPADAKILDAHLSPEGDKVEFLVHSETFAEVEDTEQIPTLQIVVKTVELSD